MLLISKKSFGNPLFGIGWNAIVLELRFAINLGVQSSLFAELMNANQTSRTIYNSYSTHLVNKFEICLKFSSCDSWTEFNKLCSS
jgi:hypothetical protein